ncbi:MAG: hypothetical protein ACRD6W_09810 [Nitrososphaerales archaeon]
MNLKGSITLKTSVRDAAAFLENMANVGGGEVAITIEYDLTALNPQQQKYYAGKFRAVKMAEDTHTYDEHVEKSDDL